MSMRLNLSGFKLVELRNVLSTRDQTVSTSLMRRLNRENATHRYDPVFIKNFSEAVSFVLDQNSDPSTLTEDTDAYSVIAEWLIDSVGRHPVPDCDLKYLPLLELLDVVEQSPDPILRQQLGHLLEGRPLFGGHSPTSPIYGFLSCDEARNLSCRLRSISDDVAEEPEIGEIADDLADFLEEITSKSLDVWASIV